MRMLRTLLVSGSAAVMAGALTFTAGSVASTASAHAPSARFLSEARSALVSYLRHNHPQIQFAHPGEARTAVKGTAKVGSFNWSGWADTSTTKGAFTKVSGSWPTPKVSCTKEDQLTSEWVGLDGYSTNTVEQDGTIGWCFEGTAVYFTWYEMFPAGTVEVGKSLQPGDKISASVTRSSSTYTLALKDATHPANSFSVKKSCSTSTCKAESAEWIAERPEFSTTGIAPLVNFASWKLSNGKEIKGGKSGTIGSVTNSQITMVDSTRSYALATASGLSSGTAFADTWHDSY
jgi:hypothetical protein